MKLSYKTCVRFKTVFLSTEKAYITDIVFANQLTESYVEESIVESKCMTRTLCLGNPIKGVSSNIKYNIVRNTLYM